MMTIDVPVIDVDSHVTEPRDLWTSRLASKWADDIPAVVWNPAAREARWRVGKQWLIPEALMSQAGWHEHYPSHPATLEDADPGGHDPYARLRKLDEYGLYAQILYPNLIGFWGSAFAALDPELSVSCVAAYNDFLVDWASADPARLIPIMALPYWNVEASVREIERSARNGHRGILFAAHFDRLGLPDIRSEHWDPILEAAQGNELSLNFHIGFQPVDEVSVEKVLSGSGSTFGDSGGASSGSSSKPAFLEGADMAVMVLFSNASAIAKLAMGGVCHRFPRLNFVGVESGFGYIPYLIEALDWHFDNVRMNREIPRGWRRPSEYAHDQIYTTFWFETLTDEVIEKYQDNVMFETDYPHPESLSPGPCSPSLPPLEMAERSLRGVRPEIVRKVLHSNAAKVYHLT